MFTVSALSALNEQILAEIHMHIKGIAVLPEKKWFPEVMQIISLTFTVA